MNEPPRKVRVLTRMKITEVSAVDRGAGENCRIVLSKRDDSDYSNTELSVEERARAKMEGRAALRDAEERHKREDGTGYAAHEPEDDDLEVAPTPADDPSRFLFSKETFMRKTYAADAAGDEADDQDEATPADELDGPPPPPDGASDGVPAKHRSISFDTTDGARMKFPNERALAEWLAIQRRIRKSASTTSQDTSTMDLTDKLRDLAKRAGPIAIAKVIVEDDNAYGISEHELTTLVVECAKRDNPDLSEAQAFARVFTDQSEAGVVLRKAFQVVKASACAADTADADAAMRELVAIGKSRWPSLTTAQQFARAFETNPDLAKRAHRRPSVLSTSFPFPKY